MQITIRLALLFIALLNAQTEILRAQRMSGFEYVTPRPGAEPVGIDRNGEPIYKAIDLVAKFPGQDAASPMVYKGTRSIVGEFPEVGWLGFCTATAVGPNVVFTASHCIRTGQRIEMSLRKDGNVYKGTCKQHPRYNDNTVFNDYAFCLMDQNFPEKYELASFNTVDTPSRGTEFLLNGFGQPNIGNHYWGKGIYDQTIDQDIVTCGPSNLGSGDSGGPFFRWTQDRNKGWLHEIAGVNSRAGGGCSYFNRTTHENFKTFAQDIARESKTFICGVTKVCKEGGNEPPPPPPDDPTECAAEKSIVARLKRLLGVWEENLEQCLERK